MEKNGGMVEWLDGRCTWPKLYIVNSLIVNFSSFFKKLLVEIHQVQPLDRTGKGRVEPS